MRDEVRKDIDELLAAPDSVRQNESELRKYTLRKAREEAEEARLRALKSDEEPSIEDLISDMQRVASDPDTNPMGWRFSQMSRKRYREYGHYPVEFLDRFGTWQHAMEIAGLREAPGDRVLRANRAHESRRQHARRYLERYVAPYVVDPSSLDFNDDGSYTILSISDTHSMFLCPFVWLSFLSAIRDLKPDCVLLNGDILEGSEISSHPQIPGWTVPLQDELDFKHEMVRQIREDADFDGALIDVGGNHDTADRLARYLTQVAKPLASLRSMRVDQLLGLQEFNVMLAHGGTILSPMGEEDSGPGLLLFDFYRIHHGTKLGQTPARSELLAAGRSGQSGHVHRAGLWFGTTETTEGLSWMSTPTGARHELGRSYMKGLTTGWTRGFGFARLFPNGSVHQYPVVVQNGMLNVEGITYFRPDDLLDPPCSGLWIKEMRLK